ncbi:MAG: ATP-binding protein [Anaerolineae bacterium]|nr:ATP-binding protein [Anaerolineae bacterium]
MTALTVLMLEDNPDDALLVRRELMRADFKLSARVVKNEAEYLGALSDELDIILADYNLPGYDAVRALAALRERGLEVPFILITGTLSEEVAVEIMKAGATDYLLKDRLGRLGNAVRNALEERSSRRAAQEERAKAENLLIQLDRERALNEQRRRMVEFTTHELKQPLTSIQSSAENLMRLGARMDEARRSELAENIHRDTQRMLSMINDMLTMGRLDEGITAVTAVRLELDVITLSIVDQFRITYPNQPITCTIEPNDYHLIGDNTLVRQIIENILSNAVRYSTQRLPVSVRLWREGERISIEVADRGIGIPLKDQPSLFEPYYRGSNVEHISGTGLGLAIIKRAVELHGGTIHLQSTQGEGTTLTVRLPAAVL